MSTLPWMPVYIGDEFAETSALSPEEYGCHMRLRLHQWLHGALPTDDERLRRICHAEREHWDTIKDAIAPLFDWEWHHARTAELRQQSEDLRQVKAENGRKGGRPRKHHENQNETETKPIAKPIGKAKDNANANLNESTLPSPSPSPSSLESPPSPSAPSASLKMALDKEERGEDPRKGSTKRFEIPPTRAAGRKFLSDRGVPPMHLDRCLEDLMAGDLTPFDIEDWDTQGAAA